MRISKKYYPICIIIFFYIFWIFIKFFLKIYTNCCLNERISYSLLIVKTLHFILFITALVSIILNLRKFKIIVVTLLLYIAAYLLCNNLYDVLIPW